MKRIMVWRRSPPSRSSSLRRRLRTRSRVLTARTCQGKLGQRRVAVRPRRSVSGGLSRSPGSISQGLRLSARFCSEAASCFVACGRKAQRRKTELRSADSPSAYRGVSGRFAVGSGRQLARCPRAFRPPRERADRGARLLARLRGALGRPLEHGVDRLWPWEDYRPNSPEVRQKLPLGRDTLLDKPGRLEPSRTLAPGVRSTPFVRSPPFGGRARASFRLVVGPESRRSESGRRSSLRRAGRNEVDGRPATTLEERPSAVSSTRSAMPSACRTSPVRSGRSPNPRHAGRLIHVVSRCLVLRRSPISSGESSSPSIFAYWWIASCRCSSSRSHNVFGLGIFTPRALGSSTPVPASAPANDTDLRLAVLIPTYDEPEDVILPTIAAAVALEPRARDVGARRRRAAECAGSPPLWGLAT